MPLDRSRKTRWDWNWIEHISFWFADDAYLLGDNNAAINKNKEYLIDASKEVGLEINIEETKYMLLSPH
jgi:hypothetical protein